MGVARAFAPGTPAPTELKFRTMELWARLLAAQAVGAKAVFPFSRLDATFDPVEEASNERPDGSPEKAFHC